MPVTRGYETGLLGRNEKLAEEVGRLQAIIAELVEAGDAVLGTNRVRCRYPSDRVSVVVGWPNYEAFAAALDRARGVRHDDT